MESKHVALKTLALAAAGVVGIEALARWAIGRWGLAPLIGTGLARLMDIAWMMLITSLPPPGWARIGLGRGSLQTGLRRGLIWSAAFGALAALGWGALHAAGIDPLRLLYPGPVARPANLALLFLAGGFIGPVAEEIFFRGVLFSALRNWGATAAITGSTVIFAAAHAGAGFPIIQCIGGLVFAYANENSRSLAAPMVIHILGNLAIYGISMISG